VSYELLEHTNIISLKEISPLVGLASGLSPQHGDYNTHGGEYGQRSRYLSVDGQTQMMSSFFSQMCLPIALDLPFPYAYHVSFIPSEPLGGV